ncbi:F-box/LRR-repeat protein 6 [Exaiptasia diaphana]|nr:F-box/LRR-repeat protein 6 [Exaiptasia diaphana]
MSSKLKTNSKGILGVRKSVYKQIRPFSRYSEQFPSDDSDSDYEPDEPDCSGGDSMPVKKKAVKDRVKNTKTIQKQTISTRAVSKKPCEEETAKTLETFSKAWSDIIPCEILLQIFAFCVKSQGAIPLLCRLSKVCRRWNSMSKEPRLYSKVDLSSIGKYSIASDSLIKQLLSRGMSGAEELNLDGWMKLTDKGLENVVKTCKNLRFLSLSNCERLSPKFMNILGDEDCPRLSSIDVSSTKVIT